MSATFADNHDDDLGPMPMPAGAEGVPKKKRKVFAHEKLYLDQLPHIEQYYKSFMHRDTINFYLVTKYNRFTYHNICDGQLKLWKNKILALNLSNITVRILALLPASQQVRMSKCWNTVSDDGNAKVFDVVNFDMINIIKLGFTPHACCWVHKSGHGQGLLAVSDASCGTIRLYDGRGGDEPLETIENIHRFSVHIITYSDKFNTVISADEGGSVEYWQPVEPFGQLENIPGMWSYKSETDLYEFKKSQSTPTCITLSPNSSSFVTFSLPARQIRIFSFLSGKLTRKYDESLTAIQEMQQAGTAVYKVEDMEFGRRLAAEREPELPGPNALAQHLSSQVHRARDIECPLCSESFKMVSAIAQHIESGSCHHR
ncbi:WD40-repeat-containing domain protein [Lentinula edodes]|uniref:WD40-repeat-containing domain protein n=1 Tax=Lentinula lateritia TaxID=40482 RepID=A0A9W9A735_9AGAR|nr:WD40-repeat-containing domain protein [Lentinula edodes]